MDIAEDVKPYDATSVCPKCGHDKVGTRYEGPIEQDPCWYDRKYKPVGKWPEAEYQHRTCERCRYEWPQSIASAIRSGETGK